MTERNGLVLLLLVSCQPSLNAYIFSLIFFLQFEFVLLCFCFVLSCFFSLIFQADTNSILFHLVVENLILHIFLIIIIIIRCSGMFHVPDFIDARSHGSKISNSPSNKSDKSRGWFAFKFNTVKFPIVNLPDLRKHKGIANKNI